PVEGGVGVGVAHALVEGGDEVVVLFAGLVVHEHALLHGFGGEGAVDVMGAGLGELVGDGELGSYFQGVVGAAAVAAGVAGLEFEGIVVGGEVEGAPAA